MDDTRSSMSGGAHERSEEEMAWDAEFADMEEPRTGGVSGTLNSLASLLGKAPAMLMQIPMSILPDDTQKHTRAALREGFMAVRSLFSAVGDGIENALSEPGEVKGGKRDPEGTWGNRRYGASSGSQGKAQRIEIQDEVSEFGGGDGSGKHITIDDLGDAGDENNEGLTRGLRADIDY